MAGPDELLTRDAIQGCEDARSERVEVPEWRGAVMVKVMKAADRRAWETACTVRKRGPGGAITVEPNEKDERVMLVIHAVVNATGAPMFTAADEAWLNQKSSAPIDRIYKKACELNGLTAKDEDEEKNS